MELEKRIKAEEKKLKKALENLEEAAVKGKNSDLERDGAVQRFEYTFELAWKFMKLNLAQKGVMVNSPSDAIKQAFKNDLVSDMDQWFEMLKSRNLTSHIYREEIVDEVFKAVPGLIVLVKKLLEIPAERGSASGGRN